MSIKRDILWRIYFSYAFMVVLGIGILVQATRVQTVRGSYYRELADSLTTSYREIDAIRGNIYAADGSLLATSVPIYDIRMDLKADGLKKDIFEEKIDSLGDGLSRIFGDASGREYTRRLREARRAGKRNYLIKRNIDYQQLQAVKELPIFNLGRYKGGLVVEQKSKREMPFRHLAKRTIGYAINGVAPVGLEGAYDKTLAGEHGKRLMQKIAGGVWMPINEGEEIAPMNGHDIITTLDINIQDVAEAALLRTLENNAADHGCVVVMEVATGQIKAIANLGRDSEAGAYYEKYNYAVGESMEPGSTFKLASLMVGLERGDFTLNDSVDIERGKVKFFDRQMKDSEEHDHRNMSVTDLFAISSNVGVSKLIQQHYGKQPKVFVDGLKKLGLGSSIGLEITGEGKPLIKDPQGKGWSGVTLPWMSVGYETRFTPLQLLMFYNAVANNGVMMKPYLVSEIRNFGKVEQKFTPMVVKDQIASKTTIAAARTMLEAVVENGTGKNLKSDQYTAAGKTGTAQVANDRFGYKESMRYRASFAGYFPADNPKYSCIVVIVNPKKGLYYGSYVAGPVFKEIADKVYASIINPALEEEKKESAPRYLVLKNGAHEPTLEVLKLLDADYRELDQDAEWVSAESDSTRVTISALTVNRQKVPKVTGMGLQDAMYLLENAGLRVVPVGKGKVKRQSIPAGSTARKNQQIVIELS
jgi:cell division protein FtsI (penicillin-binding protein 3)